MEDMKDKLQCDIKKLLDTLQAFGYIDGRLELYFSRRRNALRVKIHSFGETEAGDQVRLTQRLI
jgi:hypothetical protein